MPLPLPATAYLVCATPRSGSTLLCETLRATGVAGNPLEHFEVLRHSGKPRQPREYFDGVDDPELLAMLDPLDPPAPDPEPSAAWWDRVLRDGTTPNGVWGGKLMWGHVGTLVDRARELDDVPADAGLDAVLGALLGGGLRLVFVTRPNTVAQAVSLWRAVQTRTWRAGAAGAGGRPAARYAFAGIDHLVRQLEEHEAAWRAWFASTGRVPLEVSYDDLAADVPGTVGAVLRAVGAPAEAVDAPATQRQGDGRSAAWAARYAADREGAA